MAETAVTRLRRRLARLSPTARGLLWSTVSGLLFCTLNALMRGLAQELDPLQAQFLRYGFGFLVMLPFVLRSGAATYWPRSVGAQFTRGAVHTAGLLLWFAALPHIALADTTAIGFTTPLFIMIGAHLFLHEAMRWERWVATAVGFAGVMLVVGPKVSGAGGHYQIVMLGSAPLYALSYLLTKRLTQTENAGVIVVWQAISITLFSLPLAVTVWRWPDAWQWLGFAACGALGSGGHYCLTRSFRSADISATQSVKFLDLLWSSLLSWAMFTELPTQSTLIGGAVISGSTLWVARRERAARTT
ncbi:MAG: DMT family transporter [Burkholderiales bacterium]|nr:DMT family transporter [Burkholderiales bacterium]